MHIPITHSIEHERVNSKGLAHKFLEMLNGPGPRKVQVIVKTKHPNTISV